MRFDAVPDTPDFRDWIYQPVLNPLRPEIRPEAHRWWGEGKVRDQGPEGSCTGHALAALIDHLLSKQAREPHTVSYLPDGADEAAPWASAHMLYKNAQQHDEWEGEDYSGSSLRGVIKGFYHNGVCSITLEQELRSEFENQPLNQSPTVAFKPSTGLTLA